LRARHAKRRRERKDQGLSPDRARTLGALQKGDKPFIEASGPLPGYVSCRNATPIDHNEFEGLLEIRSFGYRLEPRYIFRAGRLDQ